MNENYLHQIWKKKRLPFHQLKLVSGQDFTLIHQGFHNHESGPDFFCGKLELDKIIWAGNIEIHVKSSDWFLHNHQNDRAYDNVILHVVFENDRQVFINNRELPTLELKGYIDELHFSKTLGFIKKDFACHNIIKEIDRIYLESMKTRVIIERLNRKSRLIESESNVLFNQVLFVFIANSFGNKVNSVPFFELSQQLPINILKRIKKEDIIILLLGVSGFYENGESELNEKALWDFYKTKYSLNVMNNFQWKKKGVHPSGFPFQRLSQLSVFIHKFDFNLDFMNKSTENIIHFIYTLFPNNSSKITFTNSFKDLIIINGFIPFLWWYSIKKNDLSIKEKVLEMLELLKSEKNSIIKKWNNIEVESKKAFDSQALLEIYNQFCNNKKCLSCSVGNKIMNL